MSHQKNNARFAGAMFLVAMATSIFKLQIGKYATNIRQDLANKVG